MGLCRRGETFPREFFGVCTSIMNSMTGVRRKENFVIWYSENIVLCFVNVEHVSNEPCVLILRCKYFRKKSTSIKIASKLDSISGPQKCGLLI